MSVSDEIMEILEQTDIPDDIKASILKDLYLYYLRKSRKGGYK